MLGTTLANAHIIRPGVFELQLLIYVLGEIMNETKLYIIIYFPEYSSISTVAILHDDSIGKFSLITT